MFINMVCTSLFMAFLVAAREQYDTNKSVIICRQEDILHHLGTGLYLCAITRYVHFNIFCIKRNSCIAFKTIEIFFIFLILT